MRAGGVAQQPYQPYNGPQVAGFSPMQGAGFENINNAQGMGQPYIDQATGFARMGGMPVGDISSADIQRYFNPYQQAVVNATMGNINETNAQQQQQVIGNAALQGALGGDRVGVAQSELARQQGLASNQTLANLNAQGFNAASTLAQSQQANQQANAGRAGQTAFALGNLGQEAQGLALSGANSQISAGGQQQQLEQAKLNAQYQKYMEAQAFPYQQAQWLAGLTTGIGSNAGGFNTSANTGSNMGSNTGFNTASNTGFNTGTNTGTTSGTNTGSTNTSGLSHSLDTVTPPPPNPWSQYAGLGLTALSMFGGAHGGRVKGYDEGGAVTPYGAPPHGIVPQMGMARGAGLPQMPPTQLAMPQPMMQQPPMAAPMAPQLPQAQAPAPAPGFVPAPPPPQLSSGASASQPAQQTNLSGMLDSAVGAAGKLRGILTPKAGSPLDLSPGSNAAFEGANVTGLQPGGVNMGGSLPPIYSRGGTVAGFADGGMPTEQIPGSDDILPSGFFMPQAFEMRPNMPPQGVINQDFGTASGAVEDGTFDPIGRNYNPGSYGGQSASNSGRRSFAPEEQPFEDEDIPDVIRTGGNGPANSQPAAGIAPQQPTALNPSGGANAQRPFGLGILPDKWKNPLLAAGLSMMANKSPFLGVAAGEAGLAGLNHAAAEKKQDVEERKVISDETYKKAQAKYLIDQAKRFQDQLAIQSKSVDSQIQGRKDAADQHRVTQDNRTQDRQDVIAQREQARKEALAQKEQARVDALEQRKAEAEARERQRKEDRDNKRDEQFSRGYTGDGRYPDGTVGPGFYQYDPDKRAHTFLPGEGKTAPARPPTATERNRTQSERNAVGLIDESIAMIDDAISGKTGPVTGLGGTINRLYQLGRGMVTDEHDTTPSDFQQRIELLQTTLPRIIAGTSRINAGDRAEVQSIIGGISKLKTPEEARNNLVRLRELMTPKEEPAKVAPKKGDSTKAAPPRPPGMPKDAEWSEAREGWFIKDPNDPTKYRKVITP